MTKRRRRQAGLPKHARRKVTVAQVQVMNRQPRTDGTDAWVWVRDRHGRLHREPVQGWYD